MSSKKVKKRKEKRKKRNKKYDMFLKVVYLQYTGDSTIIMGHSELDAIRWWSHCAAGGQHLLVDIYAIIKPLILFRKVYHCATDSTKINRPGHNIRMYWTNFRQPTAHVKQNIFGKTSIEACSSHLYAFFGTFYAKIGQFLEAQWVFEVCLKIDN